MSTTSTTHERTARRLVAVATVAGLLVTGSAAAAGAAGDAGSGSGPAGGAAAAGERHGRRVGAALQLAADTIGIERAALVGALKDGGSIAGVASAHDVRPRAVIDALVRSATARVDTAVANGRIDAERADAIKDRLPQRVEKLVYGDVDRLRDRVKLRRARRAGLAVAAKTIGIELAALRGAVRSGRSIADVARAHDVEPQAVIAAMVAAAGKRIDGAVERGQLDAGRAEQMKGRLIERVTLRVDRTPQAPAGS